MYKTDTGIGGAMFQSASVFSVVASGVAAIPHGQWVFDTLPTGLVLQLNQALQGNTPNWVTISMNPVISDGAAVQLANTSGGVLAVSAFAVNFNS